MKARHTTRRAEYRVLCVGAESFVTQLRVWAASHLQKIMCGRPGYHAETTMVEHVSAWTYDSVSAHRVQGGNA